MYRTADGQRLHQLSPADSANLITARRKIAAGVPLRPCRARYGDDTCQGNLLPHDLHPTEPITYPPIFMTAGAGDFDRVMLEGRCDTCRYVFVWWLTPTTADL